MGFFTCSDHSVYFAHKGSVGTDKSAHVLTRKNWNTVLTPLASESQALATGFVQSNV